MANGVRICLRSVAEESCTCIRDFTHLFAVACDTHTSIATIKFIEFYERTPISWTHAIHLVLHQIRCLLGGSFNVAIVHHGVQVLAYTESTFTWVFGITHFLLRIACEAVHEVQGCMDCILGPRKSTWEETGLYRQHPTRFGIVYAGLHVVTSFLGGVSPVLNSGFYEFLRGNTTPVVFPGQHGGACIRCDSCPMTNDPPYQRRMSTPK